MEGLPFSQQRKKQGSGSNQFAYLPKVPVGKFLEVKILALHTFTTNLGDYTSQKYVVLGYEHNKNYYVMEAEDMNGSAGILKSVVKAKNFIIPEGCRPFAYIEATATTTTHIFSCSGKMHDLKKRETKAKEA